MKIKTLIRIAQENVEAEIRGYIGDNYDPSRQGFYRRGLSGEGYNGGYRDALIDVMLLLNGNIPNRKGWWKK